MKLLFTILLSMQSYLSFCQYNYYFGNLHSHSSYSDGNKDSTSSGHYYPGQDFSFAKTSYHMDFLGIADHNHYNASNNPGMHVADHAKGLYQADTSNNDGTFVSMYGMEWGVINNGGHVVIYGVPGLIGWESGSGAWGSADNYSLYCAKSDYSSLWSIVNSYAGAFCTLAHPQTKDYNDLLGAATYTNVADNAIVGIAVRSGNANSKTIDYSDPAPTLYESSYLKALAKGYHLGPVADHDNHYTTFGKTNHTRTVVLATELKRDSILSAYKAMRFYASDDWNAEVSFTINGQPMGSDLNDAGNSSISVSVNDPNNNTGEADPIDKIEVFYGVPDSGSNATILVANTGSNTLSFEHTTIETNKFYYFVKITEVDGDIIWTTPIWVTRLATEGTLPITLTSFTGKHNNGHVDLTWMTAQETDNGYFIIEHSTNGRNFEQIGTVNSRSHTTLSPTGYEFTDTNTVNGNNFYRLKQVDRNGHFTYSSIISIMVNKPMIQFVKVSPNPAINDITISCSSSEPGQVICKIYNSGGREVVSKAIKLTGGENRFSSDISTLPSGIYLVVISKPGMRIVETKFIKQ